MSLSGVQFDSVYNALASSYAQQNGRSKAAVQPVAQPIPIDSRKGGTSGDLRGLLGSLADGNLASSRQALTSLANAIQQTPPADGSGEALTRLLTRVSATLAGGSTGDALAQVQSYLVRSGQPAGASLSVRV